MKIFIVGSLNMDLTVRAKRAPQKGETLTGEGFMVTAGGKGANQAVACAKLGADAYMVGCVGEQFGEALIDSLKSSGADARFVERKKNISSGIAMIIVSEGDNRIVIDRGANAMTDKSLIDRALSEAEAGDYLIAQLEIEVETVRYALARAKQKGMITLLNPAPAAALPNEIFADCDYFLPNQTEAEFYTKIYPENEESVLRCAAALQKMGVKNVVITLGAQGSAYVAKDVVFTPAAAAEVVDTTAAGDTFIGAFAVKLSEGAGAEEAMRFANAAAAITVSRRGAQEAIPTRKEAEKLLN